MTVRIDKHKNVWICHSLMRRGILAEAIVLRHFIFGGRLLILGVVAPKHLSESCRDSLSFLLNKVLQFGNERCNYLKISQQLCSIRLCRFTVVIRVSHLVVFAHLTGDLGVALYENDGRERN